MARSIRMRPLLLLPVLMVAGCATDPDPFAALDATSGPCEAQYRSLRDQPPAPAGLSRSERARYEERSRDYHVSRDCQRAAEVGVELPLVRKPRASN